MTDPCPYRPLDDASLQVRLCDRSRMPAPRVGFQMPASAKQTYWTGIGETEGKAGRRVLDRLGANRPDRPQLPGGVP